MFTNHDRACCVCAFILEMKLVTHNVVCPTQASASDELASKTSQDQFFVFYT